jgi:hypothetical protein
MVGKNIATKQYHDVFCRLVNIAAREVSDRNHQPLENRPYLIPTVGCLRKQLLKIRETECKNIKRQKRTQMCRSPAGNQDSDRLRIGRGRKKRPEEKCMYKDSERLVVRMRIRTSEHLEAINTTFFFFAFFHLSDYFSFVALTKEKKNLTEIEVKLKKRFTWGLSKVLERSIAIFDGETASILTSSLVCNFGA